MKRHLLMTMVLIGSLLSAYAADFTASQEKLRSDIETYLKSHGYSVERMDNGLDFRSDGAHYFVEIDPSDTDPMYVRIVRYLDITDDKQRERVLSNLTEYNSTYVVKVGCEEKRIVVSAELFVTRASQFNNAFSDMLSLLSSACSLIQ